MKKILGKVLLALFVLAMLGYTAFTVYMVFGMSRTKDAVETVSVETSEEAELACAYAEITFENIAAEYKEGSEITEEFLVQLTGFAKDVQKVELLLQELQLEGYSAETICSRIRAEVHTSKADTVKLMVLDEDQYRAADFCNGVLVILREADLSGLCSGMKIGEVGTE